MRILCEIYDYLQAHAGQILITGLFLFVMGIGWSLSLYNLFSHVKRYGGTVKSIVRAFAFVAVLGFIVLAFSFILFAIML